MPFKTLDKMKATVGLSAEMTKKFHDTPTLSPHSSLSSIHPQVQLFSEKFLQNPKKIILDVSHNQMNLMYN